MYIPFIIISILAIFIGLINLIYMIKIAKKTNEIQDEKLLNIDEDTTNILSKFRKITTDKMRLLDNKIKIADDILQDLDNSINNAFSQINNIEDKINDIQKLKINYNLSKKKNDQIKKEDIKKEKLKETKVDHEKTIVKNHKTIDINNNDESKTDKIRNMMKKGMSPDEIAKKMKIGIGEVMLVKNLYND